MQNTKKGINYGWRTVEFGPSEKEIGIDVKSNKIKFSDIEFDKLIENMKGIKKLRERIDKLKKDFASNDESLGSLESLDKDGQQKYIDEEENNLIKEREAQKNKIKSIIDKVETIDDLREGIDLLRKVVEDAEKNLEPNSGYSEKKRCVNKSNFRK